MPGNNIALRFRLPANEQTGILRLWRVSHHHGAGRCAGVSQFEFIDFWKIEADFVGEELWQAGGQLMQGRGRDLRGGKDVERRLDKCDRGGVKALHRTGEGGRAGVEIRFCVRFNICEECGVNRQDIVERSRDWLRREGGDNEGVEGDEAV